MGPGCLMLFLKFKLSYQVEVESSEVGKDVFFVCLFVIGCVITLEYTSLLVIGNIIINIILKFTLPFT